MTTLFVATGDGFATLVQRSTDWHATLRMQGCGIQCLAVDPHQPATVYAGSYGQGVWKSSDGGRTWVNMQLPQSDVFSLAVSPVDGTVYAGCEPSMLFRSRDGGKTWQELAALRSIPSAPTWSFPPRPWTSHVRWIAPCPHDAAVLLVGIELGGLMYSGDGGETWLDHRPDAQPDVHALAWHPRIPDRAYEAGGGGTAWSHDGGKSWQRIDEGRSVYYTWGLAVDPDDPDCWYISACPGPQQAHYADNSQAFIFRWRGTGPWEALGGGLPQPLSQLPYALTAADNHLYAGLRDGTIYASPDKGETWQPLTVHGDPLPAVRAMSCVPDF